MPRKTPEERREYEREWRKRNADRVREKSRAYRLRFKTQLSEQSRQKAARASTASKARSAAWYRANKRRFLADSKERRLMAQYGITVAMRDAMIDSQGGVCAICQHTPTGKDVFHIDHDHTTGKLRALLCFGCNAALGMLRDDSRLLRAAADYLDAHGAKPKPRLLADATPSESEEPSLFSNFNKEA